MRKATVIFAMSVRPSFIPHGTTRLLLERYWWNLIIKLFFENRSRKFKFHYNVTRIAGTLHEDVFTLMTIPCWVLLKVGDVSDKICRENQNTHYTFNHFSFQKSSHLCDNVEKCCGVSEATKYDIIWHMRVACWISKATRLHAQAYNQTPGHPPTHSPSNARTHTHTHTHTQRGKYVTVIAFPRQQWCRERALLLRYTYIACLVSETVQCFEILEHSLAEKRSVSIVWCFSCSDIPLVFKINIIYSVLRTYLRDQLSTQAVSQGSIFLRKSLAFALDEGNVSSYWTLC